MNRTIQREAILHELRANRNHPTADELYEVLRKKVAQISLGTVYRNLDDMARRGVIRKLELTGRQKRFDGCIDRHHHLRCKTCDTIVDIRGTAMQRADRLFDETMRKIGCDSFYLEWSGLCPACRRREQEKMDAFNAKESAKELVAN